MKPHFSRFIFVIAVLIAGCSESTSPPENNTGIPRGALEGEYGFSMNGKPYDSGTPFSPEGDASLIPLITQSSTLQLSIHMNFEFGDGTYGGVQIYIPIRQPQPQTISISSYQQNAVASASLYYDSVVSTGYESLPGGSITITKFDTVNNLVSGTFTFFASQTSPTSDPNAVIQVTSGYFHDIPIGDGAYGQGSVTANINDTAFSTEFGGRQAVYSTFTRGRINLWANGQGNLQDNEVSFQGIPLIAGTYTLKGPQSYSDTTLSFIYWSRNVEISTEDTASRGQLIITKCDIPNRRISGTFQFFGKDTLGNSVAITSGEINNVQWAP